jgi:FG-GAP repeat
VLKGSDTTPGDQLGADAKISGNELIVGATKKAGKGRAYIFTKTAAGWAQTAELNPSDLRANANFGISVSISGAYAIVGTQYDDAAYIYHDRGGTWVQSAELDAPAGVGGFGYWSGIYGTTVVVGASTSNYMYFYSLTGSTWEPVGAG